MIKVGFLGSYGTFSEMAVKQFFSSEQYESCNYKDFTSIIHDVENEKIDYALLPIENTTTGIIYRTYDLLKDSNIFVVGEQNVHINQNLITLPNVKIEEIKEVYTHPEPISQCSLFFAQHPWIKAVPTQDTSEAVKHVKQTNNIAVAALGSSLAAKHFNLPILMKKVQDNKNNMTRFFCITKKQQFVADADKISMYFVVNHEAGALFKIIEIFAKKGINMLKLESRPIQGRLFEYCFYIDFDGNLYDEWTIGAINEVKEHCVDSKVLGCYKRCQVNSNLEEE